MIVLHNKSIKKSKEVISKNFWTAESQESRAVERKEEQVITKGFLAGLRCS